MLSSWCHLPTLWLDFLFHHSISAKVNVGSPLGSHSWDLCLHPGVQESLIEYSWVYHGKMPEAPPSCRSPPLLVLYLALLWASICQNQLLITSRWWHLRRPLLICCTCLPVGSEVTLTWHDLLCTKTLWVCCSLQAGCKWYSPSLCRSWISRGIPSLASFGIPLATTCMFKEFTQLTETELTLVQLISWCLKH